MGWKWRVEMRKQHLLPIGFEKGRNEWAGENGKSQSALRESAVSRENTGEDLGWGRARGYMRWKQKRLMSAEWSKTFVSSLAPSFMDTHILNEPTIHLFTANEEFSYFTLTYQLFYFVAVDIYGERCSLMMFPLWGVCEESAYSPPPSVQRHAYSMTYSRWI